MRAITELAGANLGAVTYHFGTKRDLYSAVLAEGLRPLAARVEAVARSDGSAIERTLRVVEVYFEHLAAFPDLPRLLLQEVAAGKPPPEVVREILQRVMSVISGLQTEGARDGSIRAGHPVLTALSVISQPIYLALVAPLLRVVGALDLTDTPTHDLALAHIQAFVRAGLAPHGEKQERMS